MTDSSGDISYYFFNYFLFFISGKYSMCFFFFSFSFFIFIFFTLISAMCLLWMNVAQITVALIISLLTSNYIWHVLQKDFPWESVLTFMLAPHTLLIPLSSSRTKE